MSDLVIPEGALETHMALLGKTGSGKSNAAVTIAEHLLAQGRQVVVIDPTGRWWGLRLMPNGATPSPFKPVIFGGVHGDLAIGPGHGAELADVVGSSSTSAIIDTRSLTVSGRMQFFTAFAEALLRTNVGRMTLIVDEAHLFMPQSGANVGGAAPAMLHAGNNLVSLGRGLGLSIILISQRPAKLHKDALTQVETLIAMKLLAPQDRKAIDDWIREWAGPVQGREILASLPGLGKGDAWVWAPEFDILERVHFPLASTFDSGRPDAGAAPGASLGNIDLSAIAARLAEKKSAVLADDPATLRRRIADLEKQAARKAEPLASAEDARTALKTIGETAAKLEEERAAAEQRGFDRGYALGARAAAAAGYRRAIEDVKLKLSAFWHALPTDPTEQDIEEIGQLLARDASNRRGGSSTGIPAGAPASADDRREGPEGHHRAGRAAPEPSPVANADGKLSPTARKIVGVLEAIHPNSLTFKAAALRAGASPRSSQFRSYEREILASGRVETTNGRLRALAANAWPGSSPPTEAVDLFANRMPPSQGRMLRAIAQSDHPLSREQVAELADVSLTSSGLSLGLRELVAQELVEALPDGRYRLADELTPSRDGTESSVS